MLWRNSAAWFGLATLLIPLAIHLLARHRAEPRVFPSLRFIRPSKLAAVRRRTISDWPLLLVRLALLAAVVAALADPLWLSAARRADWSTRVARAVVIDTSASARGAAGTTATDAARRQHVARETAGVFRSETFETTDLADGLRRAAEWLGTAPPARREVVVLSDFQLGALDAEMLRDVPSHIGLRFVRTGTAPATRDADGHARTHRAGDGFEAWTPHVTLNAHETAVAWRSTSDTRVAIETTPAGFSVRPFNLRVEASHDADRRMLAAAAQAVLAQGVRVPANADPTPITIVVERDGSAGSDAAVPSAEQRAALPDAKPLSAPWMHGVLAQIATEPQLARALSRAPSRATVGGGSHDGTTRATSAPLAASNGAARDSDGRSSATRRDETREAAASGSPSPWIVVMCDAAGRPAVLAASAGARAELVLVSRAAADDEATALLVRAALRAVAGAEPLAEAEVLTLADATLAEWQRPASDPPASDWQRVDSSDRRWLWGAALVLLVVEQVLRRGRRTTNAHQDQTYEHAA